ncbi:transketolase [Mycoplasmatota bacterium]|nr:transketolase [Mycoplasmatota bacterium]
MKNLAINAVRFLGVDAINRANSGHPGIVLGAAPMAFQLFTENLNIDIKKEDWINRDRFILSAGHGSMLLYALNHLSGYPISLEDLKNFRQIGITPGHPEYGHTAGVETTSGPLGQGISNAVGMALAESHLAAVFNKEGFPIINHHTYVICGDGDLQEGVAMESASLAGHLGLGKLIVLFDSNDIQLDGKVSLANSDDIKSKFGSMHWQYLKVADGNDIASVQKALNKAKKDINRPTIIEVKTQIGFGTELEGTSKAHGAPIGEAQRDILKDRLNWDYAPFEVPQEAYSYYRKRVFLRGQRVRRKWNNLLAAYKEQYPNDFDLLSQYYDQDIHVDLSLFSDLVLADKEATRSVSGKTLNILSKTYPNIIGGSADLTSSTKAKGADGDFSAEHRIGRNINFGVREHAMAAITNGIVLHGGLKAFSGGFFVFSDYMKPSIRLAAIMNIPSIFVFTHDSVGVGEDGPTHQPIEQLAGLRAIPNLNVIRPADARETIAAWKVAIESKTTPTVIVLTRQGVKNQENTSFEGLENGAYVCQYEENELHGILIAAGSEVGLALEAQKSLKTKGYDLRVVSMPSMFMFDQSSKKYQKSVLPGRAKKIAIEMGSSMPWYKYSKNVFGIDRFGVSAPINQALEALGFTKEALEVYIEKVLKA